jgi:hypothetical protein
MTWWTARRGVQALAASLIFAAGIGTGWTLWRPKPPEVETYAQEKRQADGSLVLERKPQPDARPAHEIPKGAKLERLVQVHVKPRSDTPTAATGTPGSGPVNVLPELPPVTVDLSLVRLSDQTRRVIVSSPNGDVIGGVDVPVEAAREAKALRWAAGYEFARSTWGKSHSIVVQRDLGPLRLGGRVGRVLLTTPIGGASTGTESAVSVMVRF